MIGTNKNNNKPLLYCESINNILLHIKNELLNNEYKLHEIAIIGPVKISTISDYQPQLQQNGPLTSDNTYKSISLELICNYLNQYKLLVVCCFRRCKVENVAKLYSVINYLLSNVTICKRLQIDFFLYI
jgi:hypothetical protein